MTTCDGPYVGWLPPTPGWLRVVCGRFRGTPDRLFTTSARLRRMPGRPRIRRPADAPGFTLLEVVVVLVIVGLGAALVAPALLAPGGEERPALSTVIEHVQDMAGKRGETLLLDVSPEGRWEVFGSASLADGTLAAGELSGGRPTRGFTLRVAPFGSCGLTLDSDSLGSPPDLDPLTCRVGSS